MGSFVDAQGGSTVTNLVNYTDAGLIRDQLITILIAARDTVSQPVLIRAGDP